MFVIYRLVSPSGKSYIGLTSKSFNTRLKRHTQSHKSRTLGCRKLSQAFDKYPPNTWNNEILYKTNEKEVAQNEEVEYIKLYDSIENGYNILPGGTLGRLGIKHTPEAVEKIRQANVGLKHSEERKRENSLRQIGKKLTNEHRINIGNAVRGRKMKPISEQTRHNMSISHIGIKMPAFTEEHKNKIRLSNTGQKFSKETKEKMSLSAKKRLPISEETKKKLSQARKGEKNSFFGKSHSEEAKRTIGRKNKAKYLEKQMLKGFIDASRIQKKEN